MKKSKTILGTLLACSLLLVGCNSNKDNSSKEGDPTSQNPTSQPADSSQLSPLDQAFNTFMDQVNAPNVSMDVTMNVTRVHDEVTYNQRVEQNYKFDNDKMYARITNYDLNANPVTSQTNEFYYSFGTTNYQYVKISGVWHKSEVPYSNMRPSAQIKGFEDMMAKFKQTCTPTEEGYFSESFAITVSARDLVQAAGRNPDDYLYEKETVEVTYSNVLIAMENGAPSYLQLDSFAIGMETHGDPHGGKGTVVIRVETDSPCTTKMHNIHDIGTTVVTLPNVE